MGAHHPHRLEGGLFRHPNGSAQHGGQQKAGRHHQHRLQPCGRLFPGCQHLCAQQGRGGHLLPQRRHGAGPLQHPRAGPGAGLHRRVGCRQPHPAGARAHSPAAFCHARGSGGHPGVPRLGQMRVHDRDPHHGGRRRFAACGSGTIGRFAIRINGGTLLPLTIHETEEAK